MLISAWPSFNQDQQEIVKNVLSSGKVNYWTGVEGKEFEKEFSEYIGTKYSIAIANGTLALAAAYEAIGLKDSEEIITTPRSFIATASTAVLRGAVVKFADVDKFSGNITVESISPLINKKTKAIVVVHLAGWPADMEQICKLAKQNGIYVIEDCAQAHGAKINGKSVGSFGDISAWSFCQDKIISTAGEGGMVSTNNFDMWDKMWSIKDHGKSFDAVFKSNHPPGFRWTHENFGNNYRLTEIQSAIGRYQLKQLNNWNIIRKRNVNIIIEHISNLSAIRIPLPGDNISHAWYKLHVFINENNLREDWSRDRIVSEINSLGYPAFYGSCSEIYKEKCFSKLMNQEFRTLQNAKELGKTSIMFLVHPTITEDQMLCYARCISEVIKRSCK